MLTRLKVNGFKNLVDVDVRFGPFTCIAGANGVGKSNLFDAIQFLSALANHSLVEAAQSIRDEDMKTTDVRSLFHTVGNNRASRMSFEAEIIIPEKGFDDLGQPASATTTFLRYVLEIKYREGNSFQMPSLEIEKEELSHITRGAAHEHLLFDHSVKEWRDSVVKGERRNSAFVSTDTEGGRPLIRLHQDQRQGRTAALPAATLTRTVLSAANTAETPTVLLARREMQSWRLLQLEPSALRKPDRYIDPPQLGNDGSHMAATLFRLTHHQNGTSDPSELPTPVYAMIANRLSELINDAWHIEVERDETRQLFTFYAEGKDGVRHPARALSDGTLRFLALTVLERDPETTGLLCLEEPENGIHPDRVPAILRLLQDIAVDPREKSGSENPENPLRQVIINTHSPAVVMHVPEDSVLVAELIQTSQDGHRYRKVRFSPLDQTWRTEKGREKGIPPGMLLAYIDPASTAFDEHPISYTSPSLSPTRSNGVSKPRKVKDRDDIKQLRLPLFERSREATK